MTTYPYVQARYFTRGGLVEARAILWHMAEGGGTVSYLTHPRLNVSAHFVIEYSGRIVRMVPWDAASHSAHVAIDADDNDASDCGGLYSDRVARAVLGPSGWANVNAYVVAVEVEGFRRDGPNLAQAHAIETLGYDLRVRYPSLRGNLGHRDVQDYKSCPGCRFPWSRIGGHGPFPTRPIPKASDDVSMTAAPGLTSGLELDLPAGTPFWDNAELTGEPRGEQVKAATVPVVATPHGAESYAVVIVTGTLYASKDPRPSVVYVREDVGRPYPVAPAGDCADAIAADRGRAYIAYR